MTKKLPVLDKYDLKRIQPFDRELYEAHALTTLTAYCVFWLNEWHITTSLENLAVASLRMFPDKFSMVGWPEFPDITRTSRSVLQMRPKYRNLATSAASKGVFLNHNGQREAKSLFDKIGPPRFEGEAPSYVSSTNVRAEVGRSVKRRSVLPEDLITKVHRSHLYEIYCDSNFDEAEAIDLIGMLGVYDHTPSSEKRRKMKEFHDAAKDLQDNKILKFLDIVTEKFHRYLNR